jgi:hypothetical protein
MRHVVMRTSRCCPCPPAIVLPVQSFGAGNISVVSPTAVMIIGPIRITVEVNNGSTGEYGGHFSVLCLLQPAVESECRACASLRLSRSSCCSTFHCNEQKCVWAPGHQSLCVLCDFHVSAHV